MSVVAEIKAWANENYEKSFGASSLVECWTDEELAAEFTTLAAAKEWAGLQDELNADITAEIF